MRTGELAAQTWGLVQREGSQAPEHPDLELVLRAVAWSCATHASWGAGERVVVGGRVVPCSLGLILDTARAHKNPAVLGMRQPLFAAGSSCVPAGPVPGPHSCGSEG